MAASDTPTVVGALRSALRGRGDVVLALLFGSCARGSGKPDSDVDIAVVAPGVDWLSLQAELSTKLGRDVDVAPLEKAGIPLLEEILRDSVVVHEGQPGAAALFRSRTLATLETDRPWFARMRDAWLQRVAEKGIEW
jgi:predicted nucleotidyltransferase